MSFVDEDLFVGMKFILRRPYYIFLIAICFCAVIVTWNYIPERETRTQHKNKLLFIPPFTNVEPMPFSLIKHKCLKGYQPKSIEDLHKIVSLLGKKITCLGQYNTFKSVFHIREKNTSIVITDSFMTKVTKWLKDDKQLIESTKNQQLIFVDNIWTSESVVFNPVRAKRPGGNGDGSVRQYVMEMIEKAKEGCDFCSYKKYTARDSFGMLESKYAVVVSNTFKIEKYHGMVLFKKHDPINLSQVEFIDSMDLAMLWFDTTYKLVPNDSYRFMYWDILPKASASQIHPHVHLAVGDYAYYSKWNKLYEAGLQFSKYSGRNYWTTLLQIHSSLGLTVRFGSASVMAYLTPQKDFEVIVISEKPCLDFFRLVFFTIRTFMDDLDQYALSMGFVFPKRGTDLSSSNELPMMARIVSRGSADMARSDISSFDLFGTPNVNKDPFKVIDSLRKSLVMKWKNEELNYVPQYLH